MLAALLLVVLGWAVVGKHRLDSQAQRVYKATRLIVAEKPELSAPPITCSLAGTRVSFIFQSIIATRVVAPELGPDRAHRHTSRAPPAA